MDITIVSMLTVMLSINTIIISISIRIIQHELVCDCAADLRAASDVLTRPQQHVSELSLNI